MAYPTLTERIAELVQFQLPAFIREDHANFVAFMEAYYEWMETKYENKIQPYYGSAKLIEFADLDKTLPEFVDYFSHEFLVHIPQQILCDRKKLLKNIKQFYRARGNEKAFRLLFRIMFMDKIGFYYPTVDILRPDEGKWVLKKSIRCIRPRNITPFDYIQEFVGKKIVGYRSGASGVVDYIIEYEAGFTKVYEIFFKKNSIYGNFVPWETVALDNSSLNRLEIQPILTNIQILDAGMGYDYNSPIEITNPYDVRMSAVIRELGTEGEILKIEIIEPSFGYPVYPVNDTTKPTITFENTGYPGAAIVEPVMGALFEYPGYYVNTDGFLDSIEKLRDDYYYQEFSYVLRTHTNRVDWYDIVHKLIHPAGMIVFNNFLIEPDLIFVGPRLTSRWGSSIRIRTDINSAVDVFNGIPIRKIYNTFTGDGYKTDFILSNNILDINSIPAGEKPIQIFIDGVEITDSEIINYYIIDNNQIVFVDAPSNGSEIVFSFYASFYPVTTRQTIQDLSQQDFTKIGTTYRSIDQNAFRNIPSQMYPSNLLVIPGEPIQKSGFTSLGTTLNAPLNGDLRSYLVPGTIIIKQSTNEIKIVHSVASDGQTAIIDSAFSADLIITDFVSIKPETYAFYSLSDLADVKLDQLVKGTPKTNIQPRVTVIRPGFYILGSIAYAGAGLSGLNVNISGPVIRTVKTDINGQFIFSGLPVGSYTITPTDLDWQYLPTSLVVDLTTNNVSNADFAAIAKDYSITGTILNLGLPESNVSMELLPDFADLWALELDNNQISDISILSNFLSLVILGLDDNQIDDITPLTGLTNLSQLFLARNQISDISPLTGHTALYQLWLQGNQIDDITPLSLCTGIANLEISSNLISDISPLAGMTGMDALWMSANQISDISALSGITDITTLVFENNQVSNISPLSGLTNLINLYMGANQISNISALSGMTNLITLYMFNNQISNISSLSGLTTIENLIAWQNQVSDISSVSGMVSMKNFDFSQNQISSIAALSGMTGMQNLWLGGNQISDISPLSGMVNLNQLWLWGNQISDISALSGMTNLKILNLSNNLITDISVLLNLTALTDVYIVGVPLTPSNMDVINTLISRGVNVTYV